MHQEEGSWEQHPYSELSIQLPELGVHHGKFPSTRRNQAIPTSSESLERFIPTSSPQHPGHSLLDSLRLDRHGMPRPCFILADATKVHPANACQYLCTQLSSSVLGKKNHDPPLQNADRTLDFRARVGPSSNMACAAFFWNYMQLKHGCYCGLGMDAPLAKTDCNPHSAARV